MNRDLIGIRQWRASLPALSNVMLRHIQPRRDRRNADPEHDCTSRNGLLRAIALTKPDYRNSSMASNQSVAQRGHQQCQCQQILSTVYQNYRSKLSPRCFSILFRCSRLKCNCAPTQTRFAKHKADSRPPRPLCSCGFSRCTQRLLDAR